MTEHPFKVGDVVEVLKQSDSSYKNILIEGDKCLVKKAYSSGGDHYVEVKTSKGMIASGCYVKRFKKVEPSCTLTSNTNEISPNEYIIKEMLDNIHGLNYSRWPYNVDYGFDVVDKVKKDINNNKKTIMSSFKETIKKITRTEPNKTFVKAGFMDSNDNWTESGKDALFYVLFEINKDALKKLADAIVAEQETK